MARHSAGSSFFFRLFSCKRGDGVSVLLVWRPDENQRVTVLAGCAW